MSKRLAITRYSELAKLRNKLAEQRDWIERCGGSLGGYLLRYGSKDDADHMGDGAEAIWAADSRELKQLEDAIAARQGDQS